MKNLGSINGKIEILMDADQHRVALIASSNYSEFNAEEALDLSDVLQYAATNQMDLLPECKNFQRKAD